MRASIHCIHAPNECANAYLRVSVHATSVK